MGQGTLGEIQDGSGDPWRGPGRVEGPLGGLGPIVGLSRRFGTGRGTLGEVQNGSRDLEEVHDGLGDPRGG